MKKLIFITHADVIIDAEIPITKWQLSATGIQRHTAFNHSTQLTNVQHIYCSDEQKAIDGAGILSEHLDLETVILPELGEMNRSSTGYLPREVFQQVVNEFFAKPNQSIRGWESASDAQDRIHNAVLNIIHAHKNHTGDIAVVSHGGVGALLLCKLLNTAISIEFDQTNDNGGNYFVIDTNNLSVISGWQSIG